MAVIPKYLEDGRQLGDVLADAAFLAIHEQPGLRKEIQGLVMNKSIKTFRTSSPALEQLVQSIRFPEFMDTGLMDISERFFQKYTFEIMGILGLYSLPYCYAAAEGAKVLGFSKTIMENPQKRLDETGQFVFHVNDKNSFSDEGMGFVSIMKVRLMHAAIRYYSKKHITYETPINQEDMAGTNLAFSLINLRGLRKIGIEPSKTESEAWIHRWNVIGSMLGINQQYLPDSIHAASRMERNIRNHQFKSSDEGKKLTRSLIDLLKSQEGFRFINPEQLMYDLMGNQVAKILGLRKSRIRPSLELNALQFRNFFQEFSSINYEKIVQLMKRNSSQDETAIFHIP
jgi:hypothetical protein